jgi:hypothetical protein
LIDATWVAPGPRVDLVAQTLPSHTEVGASCWAKLKHLETLPSTKGFGKGCACGHASCVALRIARVPPGDNRCIQGVGCEGKARMGRLENVLYQAAEHRPAIE